MFARYPEPIGDDAREQRRGFPTARRQAQSAAISKIR
jgi:hypothetical protein